MPEIKLTTEKIIIGLREVMSLSNNTTPMLWKKFGPRRKEIIDTTCVGSYSIQVYDEKFTRGEFLPTTRFEKWAGVEVVAKDKVPLGMEVLTIPAGKWAVFQYQGMATQFYKMAQYIYEEWLPNSEYKLDHRPHFEYMPPDYLGPMHPDAKEEVWIPIK
ncbi:GyrI-like domain-containing protein [Dokdonia ponticola]|uniref:GyrI-like domain-containing protein n=1 Tax=Dokdonia ponticola TaxID=2041041 RepID=A0ABV9HRT9_9FLAO